MVVETKDREKESEEEKGFAALFPAGLVIQLSFHSEDGLTAVPLTQETEVCPQNMQLLGTRF